MSEPGPRNGSDWRAGHSGPSVMHVQNGLSRRPVWFCPGSSNILNKLHRWASYHAQQSSVLPTHCSSMMQRDFFGELFEVIFQRLGGRALSHHICSTVAKSKDRKM